MLLWAGAVAVALSLLAMHQMSVNHTAAASSNTVLAAVTGGHTDDVGAAHHIGDLAPVSATTGVDPAVDGCPGCTEHHVMALTCLVALALLAVTWLLRGPAPWTGWQPRRWAAAAQPVAHVRWRPPPLSLVELSISRT